MLVADSLVKEFKGRRVVDKVTLRVEENEVVGLLGCNGAGKSTSFRMIIGMLAPDTGTVTFLGKEVTRWPMHRRCQSGMGYLAQKPTIFTELTVEQNLMAILEQLRLSRKDRRRRCDELIAEYGLERIRHDRASKKSGGEKRRLEIARALITEPKLILLDEPFAGVDPIKVAGIRAMISRLTDRGISVLITDHDAEQTLRVCDRVTIIDEGKVLDSGPPQQVVDNPLCRRVYFGQDFRLEGGARAAEAESSSGEQSGASSESAATISDAAAKTGEPE